MLLPVLGLPTNATRVEPIPALDIDVMGRTQWRVNAVGRGVAGKLDVEAADDPLA